MNTFYDCAKQTNFKQNVLGSSPSCGVLRLDSYINL